MVGAGAILLDGAGTRFDDAVQRHIWAVGLSALAIPGVRETVPAMNSLLIAYDLFATEPEAVEAAAIDLWRTTIPQAVKPRVIEIAVTYGGPTGEDLPAWARHCGLSMEETVQRHAEGHYSVAAIGFMPGFPYLSGMDERLAWPRRDSPRARVPPGAVIVGGTQAAIMPSAAPSGWHIVGHTDMRLFDPAQPDGSLLRPGDTVRFVVDAVLT